MSLSASRPAAPVVAPAPQAAPTPPDREPSSPPAAHPFAEMLRQNRAAEHAQIERPRQMPPAEATEQGANPTESAGSEDAPATNELSTRSEPGRARARTAAGSRGSARSPSPTERPERERDGGTRRGADDDDATSAADAGAATASGVLRPEASQLIDFEARATAEARQQPGDADPRHAGAAMNTLAGADSAADAAAGSSRARGVANEAAEAAGAGRGGSRPRDSAGPASASFAQALAEAKTQDRPATAAAVERPFLTGLASTVAPHEAPAATATAGDAATPTTTLPAPVDSPEFASALGVQVSVFVREGVQHAELHLNPAETGPVSIAITLEGTQAHVEFGADLAATRQAIENGLPALAGALRDAGFTLAGGGVAQHSRSGSGRGGDDPAERGGVRRPPGRGSDAVVAAVQRASHRVAAGGVDLYA